MISGRRPRREARAAARSGTNDLGGPDSSVAVAAEIASLIVMTAGIVLLAHRAPAVARQRASIAGAPVRLPER
jgi:hypothetical protein